MAVSGTSFRVCKRKDLRAVSPLVNELYAADPGGYAVQPDIDSTFAEFKRQPEKGSIIVFEKEGEVVGYAILVFFWSNEFGGDIIEIDELLVAEKHRGSGIGRLFFRWLNSAYSNCAGYALQVSDSNEVARRLYTSVGFTPSPTQYFFKQRS